MISFFDDAAFLVATVHSDFFPERLKTAEHLQHSSDHQLPNGIDSSLDGVIGLFEIQSHFAVHLEQLLPVDLRAAIRARIDHAWYQCAARLECFYVNCRFFAALVVTAIDVEHSGFWIASAP